MPTNTDYTPAEIDSRAEALKQKLINIALARKIATSPDELAVRDILPSEDLNYSREYWTSPILTTNSFQPAVSVRVADNKVIGFFGVANPYTDKTTTELRFKIGPGGSKILNVYELEPVLNEQNKIAVFDEDIIYKNGEYATIEAYLASSASTGTSTIALLGFVVEPKGETVNQG
jgi:hypothetical protein